MIDVVLTVQDIAKILKVKPNTVRSWICRKEVIPNSIYKRFGGCLRFNAEKTFKWIETEFEEEVKNDIN